MGNLKEDDLLRGARAFDQQVLAEIYDRYSTPLYRYAMRLLGEVVPAEECVAETFTRFLQALRAGKGPQDHLQAYLYRIAHNWITDYYRRQPPPALALDEEWGVDRDAHPGRLVEGRYAQERVRLALRALTPEQRQVVVLRFLEGFGNEMVAAALDKPLGAVKALQHRALGTLRRLLAPVEEEENEFIG